MGTGTPSYFVGGLLIKIGVRVGSVPGVIYFGAIAFDPEPPAPISGFISEL